MGFWIFMLVMNLLIPLTMISFGSYFLREEIRKGKYLIIFEKSKLLDSLVQMTDARKLEDGSYYPGKWTHYGIYT